MVVLAPNVSSDVHWEVPYWGTFYEVYPRNPHSKSHEWALKVAIPVVCIFGYVGNTMSFIVMCRRRMRRQSYAAYLMALSIADNVSLSGFFLAWVNTMCLMWTGDLCVQRRSTTSCKLVEYVIHALQCQSSFLVIAVSAERLAVVRFPLIAPQLCTPKTARCIIFVLTLVVLAMTAHIVINVHYDSDFGCYMELWAFEIYASWGLSYLVDIPLVAVFLINIGIVFTLWRSRGFGASDSKTVKTQKVTRTILSISIAFIVLNVPVRTVAALTAVDPSSEALIAPLNASQMTLMANYAVNFYLYVITGNDVRQVVRSMFCSSSCTFGKTKSSSTDN
ncbi:uncharacterized protein LOC141907278 [Tubulanus polymorphus]|uniref:uncharacterized protein LOC141907278 n=1 Tax=Tubulanus polymorphus TaxID=672921 RepID=UPI003DA5451F